jgi:hypothetical protein
MLMAALALLLAACGGGGSSPSTGGATAEVTQQGGTPPAPGEGPDDEDPTLADRAARGLEISPVPVDTSKLSPHQRQLVGLGSYIVNAASDCAGCHSGPAGFLAGGNPFPLDGAGHVVWSRNLTPDAATGLSLTPRQFLEAIRTGRDFHPGETRQLVVMPWTTLRWASDLDLAAIYAYLRAVPAVRNEVPPDVKSDLPLPAAVPFPRLYTDGEVTRLLTSAHQSFDVLRGLEVSPLRTPKLRGEALEAYGRGSYIANTLMHCNDCHTHPDRTVDPSKVNTADFLTGGTVFKTPPPLQPLLGYVRATSANLQGAQHGFFNEPDDSFARFHDIIAAGALTDETPPRPLAFPMSLVAANLAKLLDADLQGVYAYAKGSPSTSGPSDVEHQPPARACAASTDCGGGETCAASGECVGGACSSDLDCGTCQTCGAGACQAPAADSACVLTSQ